MTDATTPPEEKPSLSMCTLRSLFSFLWGNDDYVAASPSSDASGSNGSTISDSRQNRSSNLHNRSDLLVPLVAACCFLVVTLLAWTEYTDYDKTLLKQQHQQQLNEPSSESRWSWPSSFQRTHETPVLNDRNSFSCRIGQIQFHLPHTQRFPDIILAGAAKSGTTTLSRWLLEHPQMLATKSVECHFFTTGIHPREMDPLLMTPNSNGKNASRVDMHRRRHADTSRGTTGNTVTSYNIGKSRDELICELRTRYLHQWPSLSSSLVTTRLGEHAGDHPVPVQKTQKHHHPQRNFTLDKTPDYLFPSRVPALMKALLFDDDEDGVDVNNNKNDEVDVSVDERSKRQQQTKIVVILRNPIDRAYSHYRMGQRMMREEHIPFETFIERELQLLREFGLTNFHFNKEGSSHHDASIDLTTKFPVEKLDHLYDQLSDQLKGHNYLSRGLYAMQLERFVRHGLGGNETLLVLPYLWLKTQPALVYSRLLEFVGTPDYTLSEATLKSRFNYNNVVTDPLANATRARLKQFFAQPNQALVDLLAQNNHTGDYDWKNLLES